MLQKLKYSFLKVMQSLRVFFRFFQNWLMFLSTFFLSIISASVLPLFSLFLSLKCWIEKTQWRNQLIRLLRPPSIFIKFIYLKFSTLYRFKKEQFWRKLFVEIRYTWTLHFICLESIVNICICVFKATPIYVVHWELVCLLRGRRFVFRKYFSNGRIRRTELSHIWHVWARTARWTETKNQ